MTIIIECLVAWVVGLRGRRALLGVALVQVLTNPLVLSLVSLAISRFGIWEFDASYWLLVITLEVLVVLCEAFLLSEVVPSCDWDAALIRNPLLLSVVLNLASYFLGNPAYDLLSSIVPML